jgi:imidazolonepropionase-like amidohydrolase
VKIAMGTDSGVLPHGRNLEELLLMAEGGMSPREVLAATTRSAADLLGIGDDTGTLSLGKRADVVAVAGDPLDLDSLRANIRAVYQDGRLVRGAVGA